MEFPLKWEIHNNSMMYITMSTPIMTCLIKYFPFRAFNEVWLYHCFMVFPLNWEIHNNIKMYITNVHSKKSYIRGKCIQLYSKVKHINLMRPLYEHGELTVVNKKY
jgi:hypothetical protein